MARLFEIPVWTFAFMAAAMWGMDPLAGLYPKREQASSEDSDE